MLTDACSCNPPLPLGGPPPVLSLPLRGIRDEVQWFLAQLAYSPSFYQAVMSDESTMGEVVDQWLLQHADLADSLSKDELEVAVPEKDMRKAVQHVSNLLGLAVAFTHGAMKEQALEVQGAFNVILRFRGSWEAFITAMLERTEPGLGSLQAGACSRVAAPFSKAALRFQLANLTSAFVAAARDGPAASEPVLALVLGADGTPVGPRLIVTPAQWVIPPSEAQASGSCSDGKGALAVPAAADGASRSRRSQADFGVYIAQQAFNASSVGVVGELVSASTRPLATPSAAHYTIGKVVAASSAAAAPLGSPHAFEAAARVLATSKSAQLDQKLPQIALNRANDLIDQFGDDVQDGCGRADSLRQLLQRAVCLLRARPLLLAEAAVCAGEPNAERHCAYPDTRWADGGYTDNLAAAMTVGALQSAPGAKRNRPLLLLLTDNQQCSFDAEPTDSGKCGNLQAAGLFSGVRPAPPGEPYSGWFGLSAPSEQVFAAEWADVASGLQPLRRSPASTAEKRKRGDEAGPERLPPVVHAVRVRTTTVDNAAYGVSAGSPVDVLLLVCDGPVGLVGFEVCAAQLISRLATCAFRVGPLRAVLLLGYTVFITSVLLPPAPTGNHEEAW